MLLQAIMGRGRAPDNDYGEAMARQAEEATQRQVLGDAADAWKTAVAQRSGRQGLEYNLTGGREQRDMLARQAQAEAAAKAAALAAKMEADQDRLAQDWKVAQGDFATRKEVAKTDADARVAAQKARPMPRASGSSGNSVKDMLANAIRQRNSSQNAYKALVAGVPGQVTDPAEIERARRKFEEDDALVASIWAMANGGLQQKQPVPQQEQAPRDVLEPSP